MFVSQIESKVMFVYPLLICSHFYQFQLFSCIFFHVFEIRSNEGDFHFGRTSFGRSLSFVVSPPAFWCFQCTDEHSLLVFQIVAQRAGETQVRRHPFDP